MLQNKKGVSTMISQSQNNDLKRKQVQPGQFEALTRFYRYAIDNTPDMSRYGRWIYGLHPTEDMIRSYVQSGAMYTCGLNDEIRCAFALTPNQGSDYHHTNWEKNLKDDEVAVVHLLCVNPDDQHQGIGRRSMELAMELAREMGKKAIRLDALACNSPAHRLYESLGFRQRGTAHWFADNVGWTDFYLYERLL